MNKESRNRVTLAVVMPVCLLMVILALAVGLSRILLSEKPAAATATALLAAATILGVSVVAATRRRMQPAAVFAAVVAVIGLTAFFGGLLLALTGGPGQEEAAGGPAATVNIVAPMGASASGFDNKTITVPADTALSISFDNQETGVQHNVQVFDGPDTKAAVLLDGEVVTGPTKITYELDPLAAGAYAFNCKVHPTTMIGTIVADPDATTVTYSTEPVTEPSATPSMDMSPGASPTEEPDDGGSAGKPTTLEVTAPVGAVTDGFTETSLSAVADRPIAIEFDNQDDGVPHNIEIMSADPATDPSAESLFQGEIITGPTKTTYHVPPLPAGSYFYRCTVHPTTMTGTLTVK